MKLLLFALLLGLSTGAWAQKVHPAPAAAAELVAYREVNRPAAAQRLRAELSQHPAQLLNAGRYEPGYLRPLAGGRVLLPGLRYHVGQRLVQAQDSLEPDSTHFWPLAALRGFDLGGEDAPGTQVRRYRVRLVQEGRAGARREAVQVLTSIDAGPLLLAWLPLPAAEVATPPGAAALSQVLLAGSGIDATQPLRPLELSQPAVLRLFGARADNVLAFAQAQNLRFDQPADITRLFNYYNRVAVAK